jgi:hypothetical protein
MRGAKTFNKTYSGQLFGKHHDEKAALSIGRNASLVEQRNELLMYRYYYYGAHSGKRWEAVIKALSKEFYLAECTVAKIIGNNPDLGRRILNEKPTLTKLKRKYRFFNW